MRTAFWLAIVGIGLALHASQADAQQLELLEQTLDRAAEALPAPDDADRPTLGLSTAVEGEPGGGVSIEVIVPDGPAARAGLREGDLITQANGKAVNSADDLGQIVGGAKVGDTVTFTIRAAGRDKTVEVTFAPRGSEPAPAPSPSASPMPPVPGDPGEPLPGEPLPGETEVGPAIERPALPIPGEESPLEGAELGDRPTLGVSVGPLSEAAAVRYGVPTRRGALITAVRPEGPADRAGIPVGGVVVAVDGVRIDTADQLVDAIRTSNAGQEIELSYYNGPTLTRKTVRLGSAGPPPAGVGGPSPRTNRIDLGVAGDDRPLSPIGERMPNRFGPPLPENAGADEASELAALRQELQQLREEVRTLQERLDRLEGSPAARPAADDEGAAASPPRFAPPPPTP